MMRKKNSIYQVSFLNIFQFFLKKLVIIVLFLNLKEGAEITLSVSPVQPYDLYYIKYADDFQSFIDISMMALVIYATTEVYIAFFKPSEEINLSVVWCTMALMYGISCLGSIALNYLRTEEASLLYVFTCLSFILSLIIQLADTTLFDFNLKAAFKNVSTNTLNLFNAQMELNSFNLTDTSKSTTTSSSNRLYSQLKTFSTNELLFTCFIALCSGLIGGLLFFPSFRLARLHFLCLKFSNDSKLKRFIYYVNFILPLVVSFCWIKMSNSKSKYASQTKETNQFFDTNDTVKQFLSMVAPPKATTTSSNAKNIDVIKFIYDFLVESNIKIYLIIVIFIMRLSLFRHYAQSYLNLAYELAHNLRKRSTRITNLKYISTVSSIYQYYGVVASQYVVPLFVLLFMSLLLKTLGDYSWCGSWSHCSEFVNTISNYTQSFKPKSTSPHLLKTLESSNFNVTLSHNILNKIFSPYVLRSLIGYFTFWTSTIWFTISCFGLVYYNYIDRQN
jgi:hypothetical protein